MTEFEKIIASQRSGFRLYSFLLVINPVQDKMRIVWVQDPGEKITPQDRARIVKFLTSPLQLMLE